jgi:hypothetical protein
MSAPRFRRAHDEPERDWSNADLDKLARRVSELEDFAEQVNDYLHEEPDQDESPEESLLRKTLLERLASEGLKKDKA